MSITAIILADSITPNGVRLTTFLCRYPRFIHSEVLTHRMFSRNSASSRAIPAKKMLNKVYNDPVTPVAFYRERPGMVGGEQLAGEDAEEAAAHWRLGRLSAYQSAQALVKLGVHKSIVNRLLEPWQWMETIITATEWANFFALRTAPDAQPEFQVLATAMLDAYEATTPQPTGYGAWHLPYGDRMPEGLDEATRIKVAVARCARISYLTHDGEMDVSKDVKLHDRLAASGHWSPFEHVAQPCKGHVAVETEFGYPARYTRVPCYEFHGNFRGWVQYRKDFLNENITEMPKVQP